MRSTLILLVLPAICFGADNRSRAQQMDYGPLFSHTFNTGPDNITLKGLIVSLNKEKSANICYDSETLRVSAAWTVIPDKNFIDFKGIAFASGIGIPSIQGNILFGNKPGPGWAKNGSFDDPRKFPEGPLPRDWAHFLGLYRHGDTVVLSYTVGACQVLEMPSLETLNQAPLFCRTLLLSPHAEELQVRTGLPAAAKPAASGLTAEMLQNDAKLVAAVGGAAAGCRFTTSAGGLVLSIPASTTPQRIKLYAGKVPAAWNWPAIETAVPALDAFTHGGPAQYAQELKTQGVTTLDDQAYSLDTITLPEENPWKSWMRATGFDFFADGTRAALCTWNGDVWIVSNLDRDLKSVTWRRFATGLFQPLGLKIVADKVYVLGRDQITRLHDLNNDGEADFYENFNNDCAISVNFHEFSMDLQTDSKGNFYYTKAMQYVDRPTLQMRPTAHNGCVLKLDPLGQKLEVVASGFRALNGIAISPQDEILAADNQGHWVPECPIYQIKPGGYYGYPFTAQRTPIPEQGERPICWLPMDVDNSSGGGAFVTSEKWGPLNGRFVTTSYGKCGLFLLLREEIPGGQQGGVVRFPIAFGTGIMRARFNAADGQLYLCGMRGWDTTASRDGGFYRVRYTGKPANLPLEMHTSPACVAISYSDPLDRVSAVDPENYAVEAFNVVRNENYGSPEYSPTVLKRKGRDPLTVASVRLSSDLKTIYLDVPELQTVSNLNVTVRVTAENGVKFKHQICATLHHINPLKRGPGEVAIESFSAEQSAIVEGGQCQLKWTTQNASAVRIESPQHGAVTDKLQTTGAVTLSPKSDALYKLTAEGPGGSVVSWVKVGVVKANEAAKPEKTAPGLETKFYDLTNPQALPDFKTLKPYAEAITPQINFPVTAGEIANSKREDHVGIVYTGFIEVPTDGMYKLHIASDDGSALYLHGVRLIDNDRQHNMEEASGVVGLKAGKHPLRIEYFEDTGGAGLIFSYEGPGIPKQPVPAAALSH